MNENIPVLALENVTYIYTYSSCTNLSAQDVAKMLSEQGHGFIYFFEIGVWELKLSMIIHPLLDESRLTWTLNTILKSKCPNLLLAQMKKYSTCFNFSGNIEYPPASYKCTNK